MRKTVLLIVGLSLCSAVLSGCEEQQAAAQRHLDAAIAQIDIAERGYTDQQGEDYQAHRNAALDKATSDLQSVLANGTPQQKVVAGRQLAQIKLSTARYEARRALTDYAGLASRSASMTLLSVPSRVTTLPFGMVMLCSVQVPEMVKVSLSEFASLMACCTSVPVL